MTTPSCLPSIVLPHNADGLATFELFFTVELLTILVTETNRYAKRFLDEKLDTLGLISKFMSTFSEEKSNKSKNQIPQPYSIYQIGSSMKLFIYSER